MDNQQGSTVQHVELCSMLCGSLDVSGFWGRMATCMAESLSCSPETSITLLIGSSPIQKVQKENISRLLAGKKNS